MRFRAWSAAFALLLCACGSSPSPTPSVASITADELRTTATAFFQGYLDCMTNPPAAAVGMVGTYCQGHSAYATTDMPAHVEVHGVAAANADPITCSQNPSDQFSVDTPTVLSPSSGTAIIVEQYNPAPVLIGLDMVKVSGKVLVDDVHCPVP